MCNAGYALLLILQGSLLNLPKTIAAASAVSSSWRAVKVVQPIFLSIHGPTSVEIIRDIPPDDDSDDISSF